MQCFIIYLIILNAHTRTHTHTAMTAAAAATIRKWCTQFLFGFQILWKPIEWRDHSDEQYSFNLPLNAFYGNVILFTDYD